MTVNNKEQSCWIRWHKNKWLTGRCVYRWTQNCRCWNSSPLVSSSTEAAEWPQYGRVQIVKATVWEGHCMIKWQKQHVMFTLALPMRVSALLLLFMYESILPERSSKNTNSPHEASEDITAWGNSGYRLSITTGSPISEPETQQRQRNTTSDQEFTI